jgi:protocatechuate 3,4-dioxygenase, beta subunit
MIRIKNSTTLGIVALLLSFSTYSQSIKKPSWSGTSEAPKNISWRTVIPSKEEIGEKLIVSGTIYLPDRKTPVKGVIVYVYHTNNKGIYPKKGNEKGNGKYHGYLRGWMKTDANGRYEFETIRPAPYETHDGEPAHIHYTIEHPDYPEYWLTGLWFSDDPRVNSYKDKIERDGGFSNITTLTKDDKNILRGSRNIILQKFKD